MSFFTRSVAGLANEHIFHRVDYVMYTEGFCGDRSSIDKIFWTIAVKNWLPSKSVHIKPYGGKRFLRSLGRKIIYHDLKATLVAMDRDYDEKLNILIFDHRVFYTFGYSVENDICFPDSIIDVCSLITRNDPLDEKLLIKIEDILNEIVPKLRNMLKLDYIYFRSGCAIFDRRQPSKSIVVKKAGAMPMINHKAIAKSLNTARDKITFRWNGDVPEFRNVDRDLVGKIWLSVIYHTVVHALCSIANLKNLTKDHFNDLLIEQWRKHCSSYADSHLSQYYNNIFSKLN